MSIKINNEQSSSGNLGNLLKYCLGYIKLINPALSRYKIYTDPLDEEVFDPESFFNLDINDASSVLINLKEFYELNPKELTEETQEKYLEQKTLALKLEEIKDKYKVDEYTKQINLNFGYFKVEIPETESLLKEEVDEGKKEGSKLQSFWDKKINKVTKIKNDYYPLFTVPIEITLVDRKYYLEILDHNIIPNIGFLYDVLGEMRFYEFADFISGLEINGGLTLPLKKGTIEAIWDELKGRLKLSEANFDEESFSLNRFVVSLSSKSNYFLSQDLKNLVDKPEEELLDTSLGSWVTNENLSEEEEVNEGSTELFFPFDYDKYQLRVLSIIKNKAVIVQGPPGTGKSQTIANLVCHLAANNKKVLFLSQKAQALKVVKDKLKSLKIDYLYGYLPNRFSQVYTDEEEIDSASNTLSGIQEYVSFIHDKKSGSEDIAFEDVLASRNLFNTAIEQQRTFYYLHNQLIELDQYNVTPLSEEKFLEKFNIEPYQELKKLQQELGDLTNFCGNYLKENNNSTDYEVKFRLISQEKEYSNILATLIERVRKEGYDRKSSIGKLIVGSLFMFKVRGITNEMPREIYDEFVKITKMDLSRAQMVEEITKIKDYFYFKECNLKTKKLSEEIDLVMIELGIDSKCLATVEKLIQKEGLEKTINLSKRYLEIQNNIKSLKLTDLNSINKSLKRVKIDRKEKIKVFIRNRIKAQLAQATFSAGIRGILARISRALRKSKKAYRTFDLLKQDPNNFRTLKEVIPVWIMDLEDASRLIPLEKKMFDYIVLDESSQCNLAYALPAMYRSEHVIFFGDSEQMRDDSIKFKTNRSLQELAKKYDIPEHLQIKSKEDAVKSVLDIGELRGFKEVTLLYHYRSPRELIGFSNDYFYSPKRKRMEVVNSNYIPFEDTERIMVNHFVNNKREEDTSEKTNLVEAKYIADLIKKIKSDERTKGKSIGVLTFFNEQAFLLKQVIDDPEVKISIIEGIQGDEKDVIIYSFVICSPDEKSRYIPLASEQGEINKELNAGRVNVAFSRAKAQVHCVTSMRPEEWPDGVWIKKYLEYVENNGKIDFYSQDLNKFDSHFEEECYLFLRGNLGKNFIIQNQVESCGFKIDFVVTDSKTNKRMALECDGPTHFEEESQDIYTASDVERQNILECAGWDFYRVTYSDWVSEEFNRTTVIKDIKDFFGKPNDYLKLVKEPQAKETLQGTEAELTNDDPSPQSNNGQISSPKQQPTFKELLRFSLDDRRDLVVSEVPGEDYLWINEYYKNGSFIGYSNKGVGIGRTDAENFVKKATYTLKTGESSFLPWKGSGKSKVEIQKTKGFSGEDAMDVRQYIESEKYTGFTRRGFRLNARKFEDFLNQFWKSLPSQIK